MKERISIIMPAYNEADCVADSIASTTEQFESTHKDLEIIVVDDGSVDETRRMAETVRDRRVRVVGYRSNKGKGYALKEGFSFVTGEFSFLVDSDSEICARNLRSYVRELENADIVVGSKRHPDSVITAPTVRKFLSISFNLLERILTGVKVSDTQSGLKGAKSGALYRILPLLSVKRYAFDAELLAVASVANLRIKEMPVQIHLTATFSLSQAFRMLIDLLGIAYRLRVKHWYQKNMIRMSESYKPIIPW